MRQQLIQQAQLSLQAKRPAGSIFHVEHGFFGQQKVQVGLQHHNFLIFDGKQHPKNIWFHGC